MTTQGIQPPLIHHETSAARRARAILAYLAQDAALPLEDRHAALAAIAELEDDLPTGEALAPVIPIAGVFGEAVDLLDQLASSPATSGRGRLAVALAVRHLRSWREPS
jgi:hypothetical protein